MWTRPYVMCTYLLLTVICMAFLCTLGSNEQIFRSYIIMGACFVGMTFYAGWSFLYDMYEGMSKKGRKDECDTSNSCNADG